MKQTVDNLTHLIEVGLLNTTGFALYIYLRAHNNEAVSLKVLSKKLGQSVTSIVHHIQILETLKLLQVQRETKPKKRNVYIVNKLSSIEYIIKKDSLYVSKVQSLRERKIQQYHPDSITISVPLSREGYNNIILYIRRRKCTEQLSELIKYILSSVPESFATSFTLRPTHLAKLEQLAQKLNMKSYTKWFMKRKLGITVDRFNFSIFLYEGILKEYEKVKKRLEKVSKYKKKEKIAEGTIRKKKRKLMEELYDNAKIQ